MSNSTKIAQQNQAITALTTSQKRRAALAQTQQKSLSPLKSDQSTISAKNTKITNTLQSSQTSKVTQNHKGKSEITTGKQHQGLKGTENLKNEEVKHINENIIAEKRQDPTDQLKNQQLAKTNEAPQMHSLFTEGKLAAFQQQQLAQGIGYSPFMSKHSNGMDTFANYGDGPSSVATLQPHPFNVLISEFQQRRQISSQKKDATVLQFLNAFKGQIKELDTNYYQQKQQIQEQLAAATKQQDSTNNATPTDQQQMRPQHNNDSSSDYYAPQPNPMAAGSMGILSQLGLCHGQFSGSGCPSIPLINEPYSSFEFVPNSLQYFYPKQVQRQLQKKKYQNNERIVSGLKAPSNKASFVKTMEKMKSLSQCQMNFIKVVFQKIDRKSKPIKKQEKLVSENLKRKRIMLEEENFDILSVLHNSHTQSQKAIENNQKMNQQINGFSNLASPYSTPQQQINITNNGQNEQIKDQLSKSSTHRNSDSISDIENRFNGQTIDPLKNPSQIMNIPMGNMVAGKNSSKSPMNTNQVNKPIIDTPTTKKLSLKKSQSIPVNENISQIPPIVVENPTTIIIDQSQLQTPNKGKNHSKQTPMTKANQTAKKSTTAKKNPKNAQASNSFVQGDQISLKMKIKLPSGDGQCNNSLSHDKTTEGDDNNAHQHALLVDYNQAMMLQNQSYLLVDQDQMDVDEDNLHHQQYVYDDEDSSEVTNKIDVERGFQADYLGLEHQSHSEPPSRYIFNHPIGHNRGSNHHQGHHSDLDTGIFGAPNGGVNPNDMHHDMLIMQKFSGRPSCQRNLDFFDFPQDLEADQVFPDYSSNVRAMGNGGSIPPLSVPEVVVSGSQNVVQQPCITPKGQKQTSFFMNTSPNNLIVDSHLFGPGYMGDDHMSWNPLVDQQQIAVHGSHDEPYFNYDI